MTLPSPPLPSPLLIPCSYLEHPSSKVPRTYKVRVLGSGIDRAIAALRSGANIEGFRFAPAEVQVLHQETEEPEDGRQGDRERINTWLQVTLYEGKVRRRGRGGQGQEGH